MIRIVLADDDAVVRMPHASGIDVAAWVQEQQLPVRILMLTSYDDEPYVVAAVQAGASGTGYRG
ncbi:MAG: response regulator [Caldilineaceae bacterium]